MIPRWLVSSCIVLVLVASVATARAAATATAFDAASFDFSVESDAGFNYTTEEEHPAELLLISPRLNGKIIGPTISAYTYLGTIYFPLFAISQMLEIGVRPGSAPGKALGFIGNESTTFALDTTRTTLIMAGISQRFDTEQIQIRRDDLYVDSILLSKWLKVDFELNQFTAVLDITPREPTPLQIRIAREERLKRFSGFNEGERGYMRFANSYKLFDGPLIDQTFSGRTLRTPENTETVGSYSTFVAADVLYMETNLYLTGNSNELLTDHRLAFGRKDPYARLFGPMQATEFGAYDIYAFELPMLSRNQELRGATVSNFPLSRPNTARAQTLRGNLPPGWTVELYRDGFLFDFRYANETGTYVFENVPLTFGVNPFELVFYGPYGQVRREQYNFNIADLTVQPGDFRYKITAGQSDINGGALAEGKVNVGILPWLSGTAALATLPLFDRQHQYVSVGADASIDRYFFDTQVIQETSGGRAYGIGGATRFGLASFSSRYQVAERNYVSEVFTGTVRDQIALGADATFRFVENEYALNTAMGFDRTSLFDGPDVFSINNRLSTNLGQVSIANRLGRHWSAGGFRNGTMEGGLSLSRQVDPRGYMRVSGELGYVLAPIAEPVAVSTRLTSQLPMGYLGFAGYIHNFNGTSSYDVGASKEFEILSASITGRYTLPNVSEIFMQVSFGVGYVGRQDAVYGHPRQYAGSGAVLVRTFIDANSNGTWDAGEAPVRGASVFINGMDYKVKTGGDGHAFIGHLSAYTPTDIAISPNSLEDPAWVTVKEGVNFVPRPGRIWEIDFPIIPTGEIDGTVFIDERGERFEQGGLRVELVNANGAVVDSQLSAYDGFYLFQARPYGKYSVRIAADDLARLSAAVHAKPVEIDGAMPVSSGNDFVLVISR